MNHEYLSNAKCDQTFKNVLRNQPITNKYKEHLTRPFINKISVGKKVDGNPHVKADDDKSKDDIKIQQKYIKNYVKGNLRTNINFMDIGAPEPMKHSHVRLFSQKDITTNKEGRPKAGMRRNSMNEINNSELYSTNSLLQTLSNRQQEEFNQLESKKYQLRSARVKGYLNSNEMKSTLTDSHKESNYFTDKITNIEVERLNTISTINEPFKLKKTSKHCYCDGKGFLAY